MTSQGAYGSPGLPGPQGNPGPQVNSSQQSLLLQVHQLMRFLLFQLDHSGKLLYLFIFTSQGQPGENGPVGLRGPPGPEVGANSFVV